MSEDTEERQRFEAWAQRQSRPIDRWTMLVGSDYVDSDTETAWLAWRASAQTPRPEREVKP